MPSASGRVGTGNLRQRYLMSVIYINLFTSLGMYLKFYIDISIQSYFFVLLFFRGPVPVLVMSLVFIASVFVLHIWGKYARAR
ncbi:protein transport protein Sec61 subunit beta [Trichinella spiralis]|uniref:protein transport protein Sec61 subunit beta n=1 Tax=Trichinella spiralis TaxID=6334 RepID=UPI0001EFE2D6|nr:protein transport protein Sec61 subunit beta [Trichinella spiralis]